MPLFGSKKEKSGKSGYPTQQTAPPPPVQQQQYVIPPNPQYAAQQGAPPPYTQYPQATAPGYAPPYGAPPPGNMPYGAPPQQLPPMHPQAAPGQTVVVQGGYDAGARFDGIAQPNIPPPPPGCAPNAAQMAQMQGANVVMTQREGNFFTGGSDGGYVMW